MRILVDTNIVLDVLLGREPFVHDSRRVWEAADEGAFEACIAFFTLPTIHYICHRQGGVAAATNAIAICMQAFEVCPLYRESILMAQQMPGPDFEDNLQVACGIADFVQAIVTRNPSDFANAPVQIYTPSDLLHLLRR